METITKKIPKLKLKIIDVTKVGDFYERQFLPETVNYIKNFGIMYRDTQPISEHLYSITHLLENETKVHYYTEEVKAELAELQKVLDKNDCAYMRFIY